jgi:hypothetical protein
VSTVDGFHVDIEQLRSHMRNVEDIKGRFAAVKAASAHIAQDDQAYGLLCGWISGIMEGRHTRQDELITYVEENLQIVAARLNLTASEYASLDDGSSDLIKKAGVVEQK